MGRHNPRIPEPSARRFRDVVIATVALAANADDLDVGQADVVSVSADQARSITGHNRWVRRSSH